MDSLVTLFESPEVIPTVSRLIPELRAIYGGDFLLDPAPVDRPFVFANFVTSLDGVVAYSDIPGKESGGTISGGSAIDHAVMGIARACADAVLWGAGSYRVLTHLLPAPATIWPQGAEALRAQREHDGATPLPVAVVVTRSGAIDTTGAIFRHPEQQVVVLTTDAGAGHLRDLESTAPATAVRSTGQAFDPTLGTRILRDQFGIRALLHEGGAEVFTAFLTAGVVDDLLLTIAPQLAGRDVQRRRPGLVEGNAYTPEQAPWGRLRSLKLGGDLIFTRYSIGRTLGRT